MSRGRLPLRIDRDHPALAGHFPGAPVVPGALLLDEVLRAIELAHASGAPSAPSAPVAAPPALWRIRTVKFHHAAPPGQALQLDYQSSADGGTQFELRHAGTLIASGAVERGAPAGAAPASGA